MPLHRQVHIIIESISIIGDCNVFLLYAAHKAIADVTLSMVPHMRKHCQPTGEYGKVISMIMIIPSNYAAKIYCIIAHTYIYNFKIHQRRQTSHTLRFLNFGEHYRGITTISHIPLQKNGEGNNPRWVNMVIMGNSLVIPRELPITHLWG